MPPNPNATAAIDSTLDLATPTIVGAAPTTTPITINAPASRTVT